MVLQSSYHYGSSLDALKSRSLRMRWPRLRQKLSTQIWQKSAPVNNTSSTTVDSSDISLKNGIPAVAAGDLDYPSVEWGEGRQATPTFSKLFSKLVLLPASPNDGHYKTQGTTSHQTRSKRPDKPGQRRKSSSKGARDAGSSSGGGGKGGKGRGGSNGPPPSDGLRFPPLSDIRPPKCLGCPFYMTEPLRYHECSSLRLQRPSDVSQHIARNHLLQEIRLGLHDGTESTDAAENGEAVICTNANDITLYHTTCRMEFHGLTAEENRLNHCLDLECTCIEAGIEDTGVMLLPEYEILTKARDAASGRVAKWYAMWEVCYPPVRIVGDPPATTTILTRFPTVPASPYLETTVPREQGEHVIRQALMSPSTDQRLVFEQIVNGIYLGSVETDIEVQQIVEREQSNRNEKLLRAFQPASTSSQLPSTGPNPWSFSVEETLGLQYASPSHSSSVTLLLQQQELLTGQPSNRTATSLGSLSQQSQMPYRTPISSSTPSTLPLQPPIVQPPYQNTHLWLPPEASDPTSQQAMNWWDNTASWNPDHYRGSQ